jgi:sugar lactone lactonase YvrE
MVVNSVAAAEPARLVGELRTVVGESLVWSGRDEALFMVDIVGRRIVRCEPATDRFRAGDFALGSSRRLNR